MPTTIVLFHQNLRLADNRALAFAAERGTMMPVYILQDVKEISHKPGGASHWWLQESLKDLGNNSIRKENM